MSGIEDTDLKFETLTISQLLNRSSWWNKRSLDNILELADKGYFGLYFKPAVLIRDSKIETYTHIEGTLKSLLRGYNSMGETENNNYKILNEKFNDFCKNHEPLLNPVVGSKRLATAMEVTIYPSCESGSIRCFRRELVIKGLEYNNHFGFMSINGEIVSHGYDFRGKRIYEDNLFVLVSQIEEYERKQKIPLKKDEESSEIETYEVNPINKTDLDKQLLNRKAIKLNYQGGNKCLTDKKWIKMFENEKKTGLDKARTSQKDGIKILYSRVILHSWLLRNGYFTEIQLQKITTPQSLMRSSW